MLQSSDFDGQVSLKLHHDGHLGSFESSSGKYFEQNFTLLSLCLQSFFLSKFNQHVSSPLHLWKMLFLLTGKSYDVFNLKAQDPVGTVFLSSASEAKAGM